MGQGAERTEGAGPGRTARHMARAAAGALLFSLPMLMTMEMWWLGFYVDRPRLALLLVLAVPLLVGLSHLSGFEETFDWREDVRDAFIALAIGATTSAILLLLFGALEPEMSLHEAVGAVAIQTVPASMGALLARSQLGKNGDERNPPQGYGAELLLIAAGALYLSFNVAPTEEIVLIAHKIMPWQELALIAVSMAIMHGFVYWVDFHGQAPVPEEASFAGMFLRFTVAGYAVVLLVSVYVLWTFGRMDGLPLSEMISVAVVLSFPGAIGAAGARLLI